MNLIPRLYDVTDGKITLDGKDIRRIAMSDLREEIGYVPQKGILFSGTIASNLRFGKGDATEEEIERAADIAQATEFIDVKTDAALRGALSENVTDSTIIIVAQRISTILHAEQILVLDEGLIVGKGTHEELLEHCEVYRQIAESQLSASELGMEESEVTMHE